MKACPGHSFCINATFFSGWWESPNSFWRCRRLVVLRVSSYDPGSNLKKSCEICKLPDALQTSCIWHWKQESLDHLSAPSSPEPQCAAHTHIDTSFISVICSWFQCMKSQPEKFLRIVKNEHIHYLRDYNKIRCLLRVYREHVRENGAHLNI